jgi:hypothetical protein
MTISPARRGEQSHMESARIPVDRLTWGRWATLQHLPLSTVSPSGAPDQVVRTVTENSRTLKFASQGFEEE